VSVVVAQVLLLVVVLHFLVQLHLVQFLLLVVVMVERTLRQMV
jgi:hypothetical protein